MNDPWDDARSQAGFVVTASGLRVPVAAQSAGGGGGGWAAGGESMRTTGDAGYRGVGPKGYQRSDQYIRDQICERLMLDPYLDPSRVVVRVSKGKVTLTGSVASERMREAAIAAAANVSGGPVDSKLQLSGAAAADRGPARRPAKRKRRGGRGGGR